MTKLSARASLSALFISMSSLIVCAQGVTLPRTPSPAGSVTQTIGISTVNVNYSRPSVRGREVWGKIVPYGYNVQAFGAGNQAPWRAGANENTVITFSHPAMVEGHAVPAGSYGLFFVINNDNTGEVILSNDYRHWGSFWYDPKTDLFRAKIAVRDMPVSTEMLTYDFINSTKDSSELVLNWEKKQFPVRISFDVDNIVMANAAQELKGQIGFSFVGFLTAANYALANKINYDQALIWANTAAGISDNFGTESLKANLLKAMGKTAEGDKAMDAALAVASENELNNYAYTLIANNDKPKAIEIFILNAKRHPTSANCFDSLGEGYALNGDNKNAIINFKKSLSLNPPANVRANSEKYLKQLGAM
jgi:hypothetical protein